MLKTNLLKNAILEKEFIIPASVFKFDSALLLALYEIASFIIEACQNEKKDVINVYLVEVKTSKKILFHFKNCLINFYPKAVYNQAEKLIDCEPLYFYYRQHAFKPRPIFPPENQSYFLVSEIMTEHFAEILKDNLSIKKIEEKKFSIYVEYSKK